jgi:hypothetical protein
MEERAVQVAWFYVRVEKHTIRVRCDNGWFELHPRPNCEPYFVLMGRQSVHVRGSLFTESTCDVPWKIMTEDEFNKTFLARDNVYSIRPECEQKMEMLGKTDLTKEERKLFYSHSKEIWPSEYEQLVCKWEKK